jgi:hypothetical protein
VEKELVYSFVVSLLLLRPAAAAGAALLLGLLKYVDPIAYE